MGLLAMKGFKNSTKTQYSMGGSSNGAKGAAKVAKVMGEFKAGTLHSGYKKGPVVDNPKQAVAIAMKQAGKAAPVKKAMGGALPNPGMSTPTAMPARSMRTPGMSRTMAKYKAAMASRPRGAPLISGMQGPAPAMSAMPAPSMSLPTGAPGAMKKGGKVMKKADGGLATSIRTPSDYNSSDNAFVNTRAQQLQGMVGRKKGGEVSKADIAQDKALVKKMVHKHEMAMHPGKPMTKLRKGGMAKC